MFIRVAALGYKTGVVHPYLRAITHKLRLEPALLSSSNVLVILMASAFGDDYVENCNKRHF